MILCSLSFLFFLFFFLLLKSTYFFNEPSLHFLSPSVLSQRILFYLQMFGRYSHCLNKIIPSISKDILLDIRLLAISLSSQTLSSSISLSFWLKQTRTHSHTLAHTCTHTNTNTHAHPHSPSTHTHTHTHTRTLTLFQHSQKHTNGLAHKQDRENCLYEKVDMFKISVGGCQKFMSSTHDQRKKKSFDKNSFLAPVFLSESRSPDGGE